VSTPVIGVSRIHETVPALLEGLALRDPSAIASLRRVPGQGWIPLTRGGLWQRVRRLAGAFHALGLRRGSRLAVLAHTCQEWQIVELAGLAAGGVVVGVDTQAPAEQAAWVMDDSGACGLVVDTAESLSRLPARVLDGLKFIVLLDGDDRPVPRANLLRWNDIASATASVDVSALEGPGPDDLATHLYTSGTTGRPKAIAYTHAQLMVACQAILQELPDFRPSDDLICWLPMAQLFQRMMNLVSSAAGVRIWFLEDPRNILECLREVRPTLFLAVPRFYEKLYEGFQERLTRGPAWKRRLAHTALATGAEWSRCARAGVRPSWALHTRHAVLDRLVLKRMREVMGGRIRWTITGSAPTAAALLEFFHSLGILVLEAYGLSENTIPIAANRPTAYRFGSVGRPFAMNDLRLAEDGELLVKGPGLFRGYHESGGAADAFTSDGYYRTGDCGRLDEDGFLFLVGRKSAIIKTSTGHRVAPEQVEAVYSESPYIDQIVVLGNDRKYLAALIVVNVSAVQKLREQSGESMPPQSELPRDPFVADLIRHELSAYGHRLARHARVGAFAILEEPLSVANGEVTTKLTPRRAQIEARHQALIEGLYRPGTAASTRPRAGSRDR
jgi:long-chain acyl-CoA synthetase